MPFDDKIGGKMQDLAAKAKTKLKGVNDAMYPGEIGPAVSDEEGRLSAFDGNNRGFASGVAETYSNFFYSETSEPDGLSVSNGMQAANLPRAIANKYALFNFKGYGYDLNTDQFKDGFYSSSPNHAARDISMKGLMDTFNNKYPHLSYSPSDFLYGKYWKKIPINHTITLRRFATPCFDNIFNLKITNVKTGKGSDAYSPAGVTAVTYLGETAGNEMSELLKYTYGLAWEEIKSEMEEKNVGDQGGGYTKQPFYNKIGGIGRAAVDTMKGVKAGDKFRKQNFETADALGTTYANFVLGPVNVVEKTYIRGRGLNFANDMDLTFEYSLKQLGQVNPKIAMIDVMTNMMTMTYNNGQFWGGGQRFYGSAGYVGSQFGDMALLKNGNFSGYVGSVVNDVESGFKDAFGDGKGGFDLKGGLLDIGKNLLGGLLGSFLKGNVGGASGTFATKAFISAEPTGDWHLTIGNPLNPICVMGNMICDNTTMTLGQGLGADDFPVEAKFVVSLKHGKPRDKGDMENMFNIGRGKIYASAKGEGDILNLAGLDVNVYGAVQNLAGSKKGLKRKMINSDGIESSDTATGDAVVGLDPKDIDMKNALANQKAGQQVGASGEFVTNMVGMIIDS